MPAKRGRPRKDPAETESLRRFDAEASYAQSMFQEALGDEAGMVSALERAVEIDPSFAPAVLSLGSVEYQRARPDRGRELFHSLLALPKGTPELREMVDEAGDFLIDRHEYQDGLALYRAAVQRFPRAAALYQGLGCCAGHSGLHDEAIAASTRAVKLAPRNARYLNDLGWSLFQAGRLDEAEEMLSRALAIAPSYKLAAGNLEYCREKMAKPARKKRKA
ncbi:MAG: tetratricopeptide repeat protein [Planctomycetes bacterium]|nr:tetratricopeptide repeat protein [Planctomycetota bacterium]